MRRGLAIAGVGMVLCLAGGVFIVGPYSHYAACVERSEFARTTEIAYGEKVLAGEKNFERVLGRLEARGYSISIRNPEKGDYRYAEAELVIKEEGCGGELRLWWQLYEGAGGTVAKHEVLHMASPP